jgi:hypothetical protein
MMPPRKGEMNVEKKTAKESRPHLSSYPLHDTLKKNREIAAGACTQIGSYKSYLKTQDRSHSRFLLLPIFPLFLDFIHPSVQNPPFLLFCSPPKKGLQKGRLQRDDETGR